LIPFYRPKTQIPFFGNLFFPEAKKFFLYYMKTASFFFLYKKNSVLPLPFLLIFHTCFLSPSLTDREAIQPFFLFLIWMNFFPQLKEDRGFFAQPSPPYIGLLANSKEPPLPPLG